MDEKKRERKISNRESARRSRLRKQKRLDDLTAQASQLKKANQQILTGLNVTTQCYLSVEAENAILRAQAVELSHRLQSLSEIVSFLGAGEEPAYKMAESARFVNDPWNLFSQPIVTAAASADTVLQY